MIRRLLAHLKAGPKGEDMPAVPLPFKRDAERASAAAIAGFREDQAYIERAAGLRQPFSPGVTPAASLPQGLSGMVDDGRNISHVFQGSAVAFSGPAKIGLTRATYPDLHYLTMNQGLIADYRRIVNIDREKREITFEGAREDPIAGDRVYIHHLRRSD